jgi:hypothetical protein
MHLAGIRLALSLWSLVFPGEDAYRSKEHPAFRFWHSQARRRWPLPTIESNGWLIAVLDLAINFSK